MLEENILMPKKSLNKSKMKKKGQVWVETVTYTMVAFILIGLILAFVKPKIDELQDKALIEQSIKILKHIDSVINEVYDSGEGNKRMIEVLIKKGDLVINSSNNIISFSFEGDYMYSEPGLSYGEGSFNVITTKLGPKYKVLISKKYTNMDLTYFDKEDTKTLGKSSTPYQIFISNKGGSSQVIDFSIK